MLPRDMDWELEAQKISPLHLLSSPSLERHLLSLPRSPGAMDHMQLEIISSVCLEFTIPAEGIVFAFPSQGVTCLALPPLPPRFSTGSLLNNTPSHLA